MAAPATWQWQTESRRRIERGAFAQILQQLALRAAGTVSPQIERDAHRLAFAFAGTQPGSTIEATVSLMDCSRGR